MSPGLFPNSSERLGCEVKLVMPYYRMVKIGPSPSASRQKSSRSPWEMKPSRRTSTRASLNRRKSRSISSAGKSFLTGNTSTALPEGDYFDNAERFIFFSRAALAFCRSLEFSPDIIHHHEWQTGLIPAYLQSVYRNDPLFSHTAAVFTIHNIAYQGLFKKEKFSLTGLPMEMYSPEGIEFWERINFMKAGIVYADVINTVSQKYSEEIQTAEYGYGLEGILRKRRERSLRHPEWSGL